MQYSPHKVWCRRIQKDLSLVWRSVFVAHVDFSPIVRCFRYATFLYICKSPLSEVYMERNSSLVVLYQNHYGGFIWRYCGDQLPPTMQWGALKTVKTIKQKKTNAAKSVCYSIAMPLNGPCLCRRQYGGLDASYCPNLRLDKILCPDLNFYTIQHSRRNPSLYFEYTLHPNGEGVKECYITTISGHLLLAYVWCRRWRVKAWPN